MNEMRISILAYAVVALCAVPAFAQTLPSPAFGNLTITIPTPTLNTTYAAGGLTNAILMTGGGADIAYCSVTGCMPGPHLFGQSVQFMTTTKPGDAVNGAQETAAAINVISQTGFDTLGSINNGKEGLSIAMHVKPGSGNTWALDTDTVIDAGVGLQAHFGYELDFNNNNLDCAVGVLNCAGMFYGGSSGFPGTAAMWVTSGTPATYQWHYGAFFQGNGTVKDATIFDATNAGVSLQTQGTHSIAVISDSSTSPTALNMTGTYSLTGIRENSTTPIGINFSGTYATAAMKVASNPPTAVQLSGTHSIASVSDSSTTPTALNLVGTYSLSGLRENSTSSVGADFSGTYATAALRVTSAPPVAFSISGAHSTADINDSGSGPAAVNVAGAHTVAFTTTGDSAAYALTTKAGQKVCFVALTACAWYDTTAHKWYFNDANSVTLFSVAETTGNAIFKGTVTPSGTP